MATPAFWAPPPGSFFEQQPATVANLWDMLLRLRRDKALPDPPAQPPAQPCLFRDARGALRILARREATDKVCPALLLARTAG